MDVYLPRSKNRGIAKCAFVKIRNEEELWRAFNARKGARIKGRTLVVKLADKAQNTVDVIKEKVGPRSYRDVLRAGVNDNYSIKQRSNKEENNADEKAELVVACKESKKDSERPKELAWKMGKQKDGNEVAPLKSWTECKVQIVEVENEWLKSSAVGRPRAGLSPEEIQRVFIISTAGIINADSEANKSSMEKRKNGVLEQTAPSLADEEEADSGGVKAS
ncbi:Uncharacterized protein TCM_038893 [Theobroma cacao]|uniref:Uncharacterized protein n=1 Tax=Theobroma cacao TaxID=3641 RepID=A0A061GRI6_THECC|nr:Uncharacterized protein TCM_038893 [Theobroma cacao]